VVARAQLSTKPEPQKLSARHRKFCDQYLLHYNGTQAYALVYKAKPAVARANASRLLADANIRAYLDKRIEELQESTKVKQERVLRELRQLGFSNIADYLTFDENGVHFKDSANLSREKLSAVSQVSETVTQHGGSKTIKLHDKVKALVKLGEHLQLFSEDKLSDLRITVRVTDVR
jgi:phage terminase small subunit